MSPQSKAASKGPETARALRVKKLALIGAGKLGEGLLSGMLGSQLLPVSHVAVTVAHQPRADYLAEKYGVKAGTANAEAVRGADLVLIYLKPQQVKGFLHEVKRTLSKHALIISAAASVTTALIERELGRPARVVRSMPNTPPHPPRHDRARQGQALDRRGRRPGSGNLRLDGPHRGGGRETHGRHHRSFRVRPGLRLPDYRVTG